MPKPEDDEKIIRFKHLYNEHAGILIRFARKFTQLPDAAEDIVHEIFLDLWKTGKVLDNATARAFLFAATRNKCINFLKHKQLCDDYARNAQVENQLLSLDYCNSPEKLIIEQEDLQKIYRQIDLLPDKCRQIFRMAYFDDKKNAEIAELLNLSIRTVEHQLYLALKTLREKLKGRR
jgi:RNA polymerase sigma-70 factor (ECF subfamily)